MDSPRNLDDTPTGPLDWTPTPPTFALAGHLVAERFEIEALIAEGGMARVYRCIDHHFGVRVALKVFRVDKPDARQRFALEAEVLARLSHPGLVKALDYGHARLGSNELRPFLALELLRGESLGAQLARRRQLPWREAVELGIQVAATLHALHESGVIHRDLKPHNLVVLAGASLRVKVVDLGLCKLTERYTRSLERAPLPRLTCIDLGQPGTPGYLPPEAAERPADEHFDVYALGVTLYQCLTGTMPHAVGFAPIEHVPEDLSRLILAALCPDPDERLPTADHFQRALEAIRLAHPEVRAPEHLFAGIYDRMGLLGVGASSATYRAYDRTIERLLALKLLRTDRTDPDDALRFIRATKILGLLRHPSIPAIFHAGIADGQRFAALELCAGTLASEVATPTRHLDPSIVIAVGLQLAGALATCHAAGVVYCDLHMGNVLIDLQHEPRAWLFDFDNALVSSDFWDRLPQRWATPPEERREPTRNKRLETMDYAAPEVRAGAPFTVASDVFALGLMLYRLLTGKRPFPPQGGELVPVHDRCPSCPESLADALQSMLDPDPNTRPSLAQVRDMLELARDELAADHNPPAAQPEPPPAPPAQPAPALSQPAARWPWLALLLATTVAAYALGRGHSPTTDLAAPSPPTPALSAEPPPAPAQPPTFHQALTAARPALERCARDTGTPLLVELGVAANDTTIRDLTILTTGPAADCARAIFTALRFQPATAETLTEEYSP